MPESELDEVLLLAAEEMRTAHANYNNAKALTQSLREQLEAAAKVEQEHLVYLTEMKKIFMQAATGDANANPA
jgi:hypothetical protein